MPTSVPRGEFSEGNCPRSTRLILSGGCLFLFVALVSRPIAACTLGKAADRTLMLALFSLLFAGGLAVLCLIKRPVPPLTFFVAAALLMLGLYVRAACLSQISGDYITFLSKWMAMLREGGGFSALAGLESDYNVPYLYLLAGISYLPFDDLLLIKVISIVADLLMAYTAVSLARELKMSQGKRLAVLGGALLAPTLWLNSAYWGQCDVLYLLFAMLCFLYVLRGRPVVAVCMAGLAFAFKLQVIFFLPLLLVFLITKRLKWRHLLAFPAVYLVVGLPALCLGRPFASLFSIYSTQVAQYSPWLNLSSPSIFAWLPEQAPSEPFFAAGLALGAAFLIAVFYALLRRGKPISNQTLLTLALLFCAGVPWCLPSMHERYFYMADGFALLYAIMHPKRWYVAPMMLYASFTGYMSYFFGGRPMWLPALLVLGVIVIAVYDLIPQLRADEQAEPVSEIMESGVVHE